MDENPDTRLNMHCPVSSFAEVVSVTWRRTNFRDRTEHPVKRDGGREYFSFLFPTSFRHNP